MAANTKICLTFKQFLLSYNSLMKLIWLITVRIMMGEHELMCHVYSWMQMCSRHSRTRTKWQVRTGSFFLLERVISSAKKYSEKVKNSTEQNFGQ